MSKSYIDNLNEISSDEVFEGLLAYGLFADKLPPVFTNKKFYNFCKKQESKANKRKREIGFEKKPRDYIRYDSCRNTHATRRLGIPTPFTHYYLCKFLRDNWNNIRNYFSLKTKNQKYKRSQIHIQKLNQKRSLFEMSHHYCDRDNDLDIEITSLPISCKFKVEADISSCFPSIYSHALVWAIAGKEDAKRDKQNTDIYYNELDTVSRYLKNNETNGLLIGPHTSNLLSEIILSAVDDKLVDKKYNYVRYIDDYCCYVKSEDEANKFLLDLNHYLRDYELSINVKKTKITRLPQPNNTDWVATLLQFPFNPILTEEGEKYFKFSQLRLFLDHTIRLANNTKNLAVYTYAMKILSNYKLGRKALSYYSNTIHHLVNQYPYLVHWIDEYFFEAFNIPNKTIKSFCKSVYKAGLASNSYEACVFSIYWSVKYKQELHVDYVSDSIKSADCVFMIMALILSRMLNDKNAINELKKCANTLLENNPENMNTHWLFIYEALDKDDINGQEYKLLKKNGISFIRDEFILKKNKFSKKR